MSRIQAVRGTKDILFPDIDLWRIIEDISCEILELANYKEIRIPIFENSNLYTTSLGQVTDVVQKEMYSFQDKSQRYITLRPEGTAGVARAFIEHKLYVQTLPQRVWYCGPMFRYERPQAGRQRQFHQLGLECIGSIDPRTDAEVINLALDILNHLKISNLTLEINSLGNNEVRNNYKKALYNYFKDYKSDFSLEFQNRLENNPLRLLDSKDKMVQSLLEQAPSILDFLDNESRKHFHLVCSYLDSLSISYTINPRLVRGLDYYNDTTFEIKSNLLGSQDTLCGGGRYDNLIQSLGGPPVPAIGWAMGMERLLLSLPKSNIPNVKSLDCYIITLGEKAKSYSLMILQRLRNLKLKVDINFNEGNLPKQIKKADQLKAITCIILGEEEIQKQIVLLKWLSLRTQENISFSNISQIVDKINLYKNNNVSKVNKDVLE
uniref:histidine-tRNA synthetase n=1 Tax=Rhodospora sordida TaxID=362230 RepID=UPI001FCDB503|nr:histidine-tRNA synthetase [Rhodospora sordida]UNJ15058.1 histidine-tRNA synthetase [Rhodospora sordida]